jgi:hypothetical protein
MNFLFSRNGDDFFNRCHKVSDSQIFIPKIGEQLFFFLSSDYIQLFAVLFMISFTIIYMQHNTEGLEKHIWSYNITHLLLVSFIASFSIINVFFSTLSFIVGQLGPCSIEDSREYAMPYVDLMVALQVIFFLFEVPFFKTAIKRLFLVVFVVLFVMFPVIEGKCSILQAAVTVSLSYIVFFISLYIKFIYTYATEAVSFIVAIALIIALFGKQTSEHFNFLVHLIDGLIGSAMTIYLLAKYQILHKGFNEIQAPTDIVQELNARFGSYTRQVDVGVIYDHSAILRSDLFDEFCCLFLAVIVKSLAVAFFSYNINLFSE